MKLKKKHIVKYFRLLTDTSVFKLMKEYHIEGNRPLSPILTFFDAFWCKLCYGINTNEYFYYEFYNKSFFARNSFLSVAKHTWITAYQINNGDKSLFAQKNNAYNTYKQYYHREVISIELPSEAQELRTFAQKHGKFILKPLDESEGHGIRIWHTDMYDSETQLQQIAQSALGRVIIEELIQQNTDMASFHPASVNTIRYVVDYNEKGVNRLWAIIRMGVGNSYIDNTSAGGICAAIDLETGIIISQGVRRNGERYISHPDSGKQIIGTRIPKWEELNKMIEFLRPIDSPVHLVGWDFALSTSGWCIVEGNACPSIMGIQGSTGKGYRYVLKNVKRNN